MLRPQQENFCQIKYGIVWPKSIILMLLMLYSLSARADHVMLWWYFVNWANLLMEGPLFTSR